MSRTHVRILTLQLVLSSCTGAGATQAVRPGVDVLLSDSIHLVTGRSLGILTNQTGIGANGVGDVSLLRSADLELNVIFSPEHGFRGLIDSEVIGDQLDSASGLRIFDLYGNSRVPRPEMLTGLEVVLIDLQDIGTRPYTYVSSAIYMTREAARLGVDVVLLDRPNPIGGQLVQGPLLDMEVSSFNGLLPLPLRHGMTMGEMLLYANDYLELGAELKVIPVDGWTRDLWFDDTGLPWVRPSPNMPSLESATHYPGLVAFEATNVSVGRGTDLAFQIFGAPWLDASMTAEVLDEIEGLDAADTTFVPVDPTDGKYGGEALAGVKLSVTDRAEYDPIEMGLTLLALLAQSPELSVNEARFDRLSGTPWIRREIMAGAEVDSVLAKLGRETDEFRRMIEPYLLYR